MGGIAQPSGGGWFRDRGFGCRGLSGISVSTTVPSFWPLEIGLKVCSKLLTSVSSFEGLQNYNALASYRRTQGGRDFADTAYDGLRR